MMQMMTGGQFPPGPLPTEFNLSPPANPPGPPSLDNGLNPEAMEPPPEPADPNPRFLFNCCVCKVFSCDSLETLSQHLTLDRSRSRSEEEVSVVIAGKIFVQFQLEKKSNFSFEISFTYLTNLMDDFKIGIFVIMRS